VVANGTDNTPDGKIETGFRWKRQWEGAHTKGNMNRVGIGICLVGNFEKTTPTKKQMDSLVQLTTHLAYKFDIPLENIKGHKDFVNNTTKCPGKNFPWEDFYKALNGRGIR
jgi:N-acetylmuramoyl-L-alanine amidase